MKPKRMIDYPCSSCGAQPGEHCRSSSGKKAQAHGSRHEQRRAARQQQDREYRDARKRQERAFFDEWPDGAPSDGSQWYRHVQDGVTTWIRSDSGISCRVRDTGQAWRWEVCIEGWCTDTGRDQILDAGYVTTTLSEAKAAAWAIVDEDEDEDEDEEKPRPLTEEWFR